MMSVQVKQPDFTGQDFYIGIDVHKKQWTISIRWNGMELKRFSMNPNPEELHSFMSRHYPGGVYHSVYEAGFCGYWIHRRLSELGFKNTVVNAADIPTTQKEKDQKRDKLDAGKQSRELENGSLNCVYIPDEYHQHLRSLVRLRFRLVSHQTRLKNRIKSFLHFNGIPIVDRDELSHWSRPFINWLKSLEFAEAPGAEYLASCLRQFEEVRRELLSVTRSLRYYVRQGSAKEIVYDYLLSVPGIGFVIAVSLYAELVDIHRFPRFDHLAALVGLIPSVYGSDEKEINCGITWRQNRYLRPLLVEAAWVAVRKDPALTLAFAELCKRLKKQDAIIRIAKKLLNRIRYVWIHQTTYSYGVIQ
jgi:transposase